MSVYTGCRMGIYEWIRDHVLGKNPDGTYSFWYVINAYVVMSYCCIAFLKCSLHIRSAECSNRYGRDVVMLCISSMKTDLR